METQVKLCTAGVGDLIRKAVKEGLIRSYKVLLGPPANEKDFNIVLMIENDAFKLVI